MYTAQSNRHRVERQLTKSFVFSSLSLTLLSSHVRALIANVTRPRSVLVQSSQMLVQWRSQMLQSLPTLKPDMTPTRSPCALKN